MVFGVGSNLLRIQCKWARLTKDRSGLIVHMSGFRLTYAGRHRTPYSEDDIDFIAVYAGEIDRCFLLPPSIFAVRHEVRLRLTPARNNQQACITLADDYDFNGAVVQLARTRHWQCRGQGFESPQLHSSSSPESLPARTIGCEELRETFGQVMDQVAAGEETVGLASPSASSRRQQNGAWRSPHRSSLRGLSRSHRHRHTRSPTWAIASTTTSCRPDRPGCEPSSSAADPEATSTPIDPTWPPRTPRSRR
jgi:hypothetical protein